MTYNGPWQASRRPAQVQRLPALHRGRRPPTASPSRRWPTATPGIRPTRSRRAPWPTAALGAASARVDQTDGGDAQRYSLSMRWSRSDERTASKVEAYGIYSTTEPLQQLHLLPRRSRLNGDQFQQTRQAQDPGPQCQPPDAPFSWRASPSETTVGTQIRYDNIGVGLFNTLQRTPSTPCATTR